MPYLMGVEKDLAEITFDRFKHLRQERGSASARVGNNDQIYIIWGQ